MADGSRSGTLEIEAEVATAEAAREAKADVYEQAESKLPAPTGKSRRRRAGKDEWHEFTVNVWLTDINSVEFGIFKHSRNRAKSRQFTCDVVSGLHQTWRAGCATAHGIRGID